MRPVTIAARVMHYGRYGSGSEDPRLYPLFVGYPDLVRGYDTGSFSVSECGVRPTGACPVFDRLLGSRMLVGNLEVRAPLLGLFGKRNLYGPIPVEIGAFFDAGVAWDSVSKPRSSAASARWRRARARPRASTCSGSGSSGRLGEAPRPAGQGSLLPVQPADGVLATANRNSIDPVTD